MSNPLEYIPLPVKEYDYDPWISENTRRRWRQEEEKTRNVEATKQQIRMAFENLTNKYDSELLDEIWNTEFKPRDLIAEFEDRQYL